MVLSTFRMKLIVIVFIVSSIFVQVKAQSVLRSYAKTIGEAMPERIFRLYRYWPDTAAISKNQQISGKENPRIAMINKDSIEWIEKVLDPNWLPKDKKYIKDNLVIVRKEFNDVNVTCVQWDRNGYNVKVSQTASIISIKFIPLKSQSLGKTTQEKTEYAKLLAKQIFADNGIRKGIRFSKNIQGETVKTPVMVPVQNLKVKIINFSFHPELVRQFDDGVIGEAASIQDEGVNLKSVDGNEVDYENREDNANWDMTRYSWGYWWRNVCWWNDGKSVGFFALKRESGPIAIDYWSKLDEM